MLARTQTTQSVTVNAPVAMVWAMLDDPGSMSALLPKHSRLEMLSDGMASVGSRWRVVVEVGKKRHETLHEVVDAVPKRLHVVRSESDFGVSTMTMQLSSNGGQTLMTLHGSIDWQPGWQTLPTRVISAVVSGFLTRRALRSLKRIVEGTRQR